MIRILAPAKLNLYLEVSGRREDGYHEVVTLMATVAGLADEVEVGNGAEAAIELAVEGASADVPTDSSNLAWQAAERLRRHVNLDDRGVQLRLLKRIPPGGGLGGGSSDAAAVLLALDALWGLGLGPRGLGPVACSLGSDVAFFLHGGMAVCRGRGERVEPLPDPPEPLALVIHCPSLVSCSTPGVYARWDESPRTPSPGGALDGLVRALDSSDVRGVADRLFNALEEPAFELYPALGEACQALARADLLAVRLTGSGSSCFGVARDASAAQRARDFLVGQGLNGVFVASTAPRGHQP